MMNYIEQINLFWAKDAEYHFSDKETALYFHLLNTCNSVKWKNPFGLCNRITVAKFGWGKTSFDTTRNRLKDAGLIDFRHGLGRGNISQYTLTGVKCNNPKTHEIGVKPSLFDNVRDEKQKGNVKDVQTDAVSVGFIEKDNPKEVFSRQSSDKSIQNDTQPDTFFNHKSLPEPLKTEGIQEPLNNKDKYISKNNIDIDFLDEKNEKNEIENRKMPEIAEKQIENHKISEKRTENQKQSEKLVENENNKVVINDNIVVNDTVDKKEKSCAQKENKENEVLDLYRSICASFPKIIQLTRNRKEKILHRLSEMGGIKTLENVFRKMEASEFLKGNNKYGWRANFDWVFKNSDNWVKIIEGNYDNRIAPVQPQFIKPARDARFMGMLQTDLTKF